MSYRGNADIGGSNPYYAKKTKKPRPEPVEMKDLAKPGQVGPSGRPLVSPKDFLDNYPERGKCNHCGQDGPARCMGTILEDTSGKSRNKRLYVCVTCDLELAKD